MFFLGWGGGGGGRDLLLQGICCLKLAGFDSKNGLKHKRYQLKIPNMMSMGGWEHVNGSKIWGRGEGGGYFLYGLIFKNREKVVQYLDVIMASFSSLKHNGQCTVPEKIHTTPRKVIGNS